MGFGGFGVNSDTHDYDVMSILFQRGVLDWRDIPFPVFIWLLDLTLALAVMFAECVVDDMVRGTRKNKVGLRSTINFPCVVVGVQLNV